MYGQKYSMNFCFCFGFVSILVIYVKFVLYTYSYYMNFGVSTFIDVFDIKH